MIRKCVLWFKSMSFFNHWQDRHSSFCLKTKEPNFFWFGSFFEYQFENCHGSFVAKLMSVWRIFSDCQNQPKWPDLPRQKKTHIAFSMFPILDTNLWSRLILKVYILQLSSYRHFWSKLDLVPFICSETTQDWFKVQYFQEKCWQLFQFLVLSKLLLKHFQI